MNIIPNETVMRYTLKRIFCFGLSWGCYLKETATTSLYQLHQSCYPP